LRKIKLVFGGGAQGRTAPIKKNQSLTSEWDSKFFQDFLRLFADGVPPEPRCQFSEQRGYVGQCNVLRKAHRLSRRRQHHAFKNRLLEFIAGVVASAEKQGQ